LYTAQKINLNSQFEFDLERELDLIDIRNAWASADRIWIKLNIYMQPMNTGDGRNT
jgi:hypothetical protein